MNLRRASGGKDKCSPKQLCLCFVYLFLRIEYSVDKFLVRDLSVEMSLGHIIVYLELGVLIELLSNTCPDVERRIPVVGYIDAHQFGPGRKAVTLRVCHPVEQAYLLPLPVYDGIFLF